MKSVKWKNLSIGLLAMSIAQAVYATDNDPQTAPASGVETTTEGSSSSSSSDTQINGFIRSETAFNFGGTSPFNQQGNIYNGVAVQRNSPIASDTVVRAPAKNGDETLNLQLFRGEVDSVTHFNSDLSLVAKLRAVFDPGWYDEFNPGSVNSHATGSVYGDPNYFRYNVQGVGRPNPLEWTGSKYMIDLPSLFMEYNHGAFDLRVGNQQIAWGQALFFRVLDVPDGLDYRRHSILDYDPEEYSDKRVPALGIRASYQFQDNWLIDGYAQKFQPTINSNANTPYNQIPSQFTVVDKYANYDDKIDFGFRVKGEVGDVGVQGIYSHRYNPDGVYRWTQSGVDRDIPGLPGSGQLLACTPFEVDPTGVASAAEWNDYAAQARLNGLGGFNKAVSDFSCAGKLGAVVAPNLAVEKAELDQFFQLAGGLLTGKSAGGLRGWIERDYKAEDDFGGGLSYTTSGKPGSLTDQLIINWEVLYTPNRTFTSPDLGQNFLKTNEWTSDVTFEKYQRFFDSFPATYLVAEFMYKSKSDLFGRYIGGMNGTPDSPATGYGGGFKAVALALQQPFPNLIWRADFSLLYDLQGGVLVQPAVRWKPNGKFDAEIFYNYANGHLGGNPNSNIIGGINYVRELAIRLSYQF